MECCAFRVGELPLLDQLLALIETAMLIVLFFCLRTFQFGSISDATKVTSTKTSCVFLPCFGSICQWTICDYAFTRNLPAHYRPELY